jgi:hypothetical protein
LATGQRDKVKNVRKPAMGPLHALFLPSDKISPNFIGKKHLPNPVYNPHYFVIFTKKKNNLTTNYSCATEKMNTNN